MTLREWLNWWLGKEEPKDRLEVHQPEWVASDLHLDHRNIIKYCNRPFRSLEEMNETLVKNWNDSIGWFDRVYYLGDLARRRHEYWLRRLKGMLIIVKGNHDSRLPDVPVIEGIFDYFIIHRFNVTVALIHDPNKASMIKEPYDWLIHGHVHNNAPHIDEGRKRINVSVDVTGFKPMPLDFILLALRNWEEDHRLKAAERTL